MRNASLGDLLGMLKDEQGRKHDIVVPAAKIRAERGALVVTGAEQEITLDGVTDVDGRYVPTKVCDEGIASKLNIPLAYLRRLRDQHIDLLDHNINGWLEREDRRFLLRTFRGDQDGIARAFLSDSYRLIDNIDCLMAVLDGINEAGVSVDIAGGDLTERRMVVRIHAPEVTALAPTLLKGYRSPFSGASGDENPVVFAGFRVTNSEVGSGAFSIVPEITVQVCSNGMVMTKDAMRSVHLGGRLDQGVVDWSAGTQEKNLALVRSQAVDAVRHYLSPDYVNGAVERLEAKASQEVSTPDQVSEVTKSAGYTEAQIEGILTQFIRGGQTTLGGVVNAITAHTQTVPDGDEAYEMEMRATSILV